MEKISLIISNILFLYILLVNIAYAENDSQLPSKVALPPNLLITENLTSDESSKIEDKDVIYNKSNLPPNVALPPEDLVLEIANEAEKPILEESDAVIVDYSNLPPNVALPPGSEINVENEKKNYIFYIVIGIGILLIMLIIFMIIKRLRARQKQYS